MSGLRKFRRHSLYSNIVNDRSAVYYTTCISKTDPYTNLDESSVTYLPGYEDVIIDPKAPVRPRRKPSRKASLGSISSAVVVWLRRIPFLLTVSIFVPVGMLFFLLNSFIQTFRSSWRIRLHEKGLAGVSIGDYRAFPLWINEIRTEMEQAYEALNNAQDQEYLSSGSDEDYGKCGSGGDKDCTDCDSMDEASRELLEHERRMSVPAQPTLALAPYQFRMIQSLDSLGWRKYPVWIHQDSHSHAAMIVRWDKKTFAEGKVVLRHWLNEEFIM